MSKTNEVETFYLAVTLIILILLLSVVAFFVLFRRHQNLLILNSLLEEEKYQRSLLLKEIENQANLSKERVRISEDIHDDIGGILSAIKLEAEFIKYRIKDKDIEKSLDSIAENTTTANQNFKELIWCLNSQNDNLVEFIHYIASYTNLLFERSSIEMRISLPELKDEIGMNSHLRRQLVLAIKECLNNIIKHSQATQAEISFGFNKNHLEICICDNGIGINSSPKKSNGLKNIEKRLIILEGSFETLTNLDHGSKIKLSIPLLKKF